MRFFVRHHGVDLHCHYRAFLGQHRLRPSLPVGALS